MFDKKKAYEDKVKAQFDELGSRFNLAKSKAAEKSADLRIDMSDKLEEFRVKQEDAQIHFDAMKHSAGDKWEELKQGMDKMILDLENTWHEITR